MAPARIAYFLTLGLTLVLAALWGTFGYLALALALVALVLHLVLVGFGVMNMQWQMFGPTLSRSRTASDKIAFTFDDGPDPDTTPQVLQTLRRHGAKATFFVVGFRAEKHPEILQAIVNDGHSLGLHSYDHHLAYATLPPKVVVSDIKRCQDIVEQAVGVRPVWFRPPVGQMSPRTAKGMRRAGVTAVGWSVRAVDGVRRCTFNEARARVEKGLAKGAIVLLHDAWLRPRMLTRQDGKKVQEPAPMGVMILDDILAKCAAQGLRPVSLDEFVTEEGS